MPGLLLSLMLASRLWYPDTHRAAALRFLVLAAMAIQVCLLLFGLEILQEAKVILVFHVVGTLCEGHRPALDGAANTSEA